MIEDDKIINLIAYARFFRKWSHVASVVSWEEIEIALHNGVDSKQISMSYDVPVWLIEIFFEKCILPKST